VTWECPEFVTAKLVAELAGWDVRPGRDKSYPYYVATRLRDMAWWKVEPTIAGANRLVVLVQKNNRVSA
jgi:hypothetical protein